MPMVTVFSGTFCDDEPVLQALGQQTSYKLIRQHEEERVAWMRSILNQNDPWDATLYDMVFPTDKVTLETIVGTIAEIVGTTVVRRTARSQKAISNSPAMDRKTIKTVACNWVPLHTFKSPWMWRRSAPPSSTPVRRSRRNAHPKNEHATWSPP